ncbi:hypothetical protein G7Z17_g6607 [Cylindrodendrum hubeiense]|uniref:Uncharacterized protein n=1 Tax=Cylindrodendrum hubeiense TaxID=595255 RepID=A0A9P5LGM1_9HYPO|nr:hypothetical protein G7Z17_g6607 [Cylindrodendrum hubeiense]
MAPDTQPKACLDVAIDHRIRRLFKPVEDDFTERSSHVSRIEAQGRSLNRPAEEIQITARLAGPALKGGIAIALQQPRSNHPFKKGLGAVIEDCETLHALEDIFTTVSCGTLNFRKDITVVDLLPYVPGEATKIDSARLRDSFRASTEIICEKEPDILLCAGQIWLPRAGSSDDRKGDAWRFESIGLGEKFGSAAKWGVKTRIRHGKHGFVTISRVNGFHPSHAMNYHSHASLLRQLQILIGAETCGMLRGDWENEEWMDELRRRCQDISRSLSASPSKSPSPRSPGQSSTKRNSTKYLPDYQELYSDALLDLQNCVTPLISDQRLANKSPRALYKILLSSGLSKVCNDSSLILRQMSRLQHRDWPDFAVKRNEAALKEAAVCTLDFAENLVKAAKHGNDMQLARIIKKRTSSLLKHITVEGGRQPRHELDLSGASDEFLKLATNIETLLLDLLLEKEEALNSLGQEEVLSNLMGKMNLAPAAVVVTPMAPVPAPIPAPIEKPRKLWSFRGRRS